MANERVTLISNLDRFRNGTRRRRRITIPPFPEPLPIPKSWPTAEEFKAAFDATRIPRDERQRRIRRNYIPTNKPFRFNS